MGIGIITPTRNSRKVIENCLNSVNCQSVVVESHIVVDGDSKDTTLELVEQYRKSSRANNIIVTKDRNKGLYDAMNLGIEKMNCEIIGILNSDDYYPSELILEKVKKTFEDPTVDACYGDLKYVDFNNHDRVVRYWRAGDFKRSKIYWGWMPPHPTFFVRRRIYEKYGMFNTRLGTAADYELMLRFLLRHNINTVYIPETLVHMRTGGVSNATFKNRINAHLMDYLAWKENNLRPYPWTLILKPLRKLGQWINPGKNG